jgi:hypothetical protein
LVPVLVASNTTRPNRAHKEILFILILLGDASDGRVGSV